MKYGQYRERDVANGPYIRTTLFVTGCTHNCDGCFNQEYQNPNFGREFTQEFQDDLIEMIKKTGHFSLLGGEPMQQGWDMVSFLKRVKEETDADVWCWTGYTFEQLLNPEEGCSYQLEMLKYIDTIVDGKFNKYLKNLSLKFRGSSNQRIIDVKKALNNYRRHGYEAK